MFKNEKLKPQYILSKQQTHSFRRIKYGNFSARRNQYNRVFSCKQELSKAVMHSIEYDKFSSYQIKIRVKRNKCLPNCKEGYFAEDLTYKCWKDRTKRKNQYYLE